MFNNVRLGNIDFCWVPLTVTRKTKEGTKKIWCGVAEGSMTLH